MRHAFYSLPWLARAGVVLGAVGWGYAALSTGGPVSLIFGVILLPVYVLVCGGLGYLLYLIFHWLGVVGPYPPDEEEDEEKPETMNQIG